MKTISQKIKELILKKEISVSGLSGSGHANSSIKIVFQLNNKIYYLEFNFERSVQNNENGICTGVKDSFEVVIHTSKTMMGGHLYREKDIMKKLDINQETFDSLRELFKSKVLSVEECIKERQQDLIEGLRAFNEAFCV